MSTADKVNRIVDRVFNCTGPSCAIISAASTPFLKFRGPERNAVLCRLSQYGKSSWLAAMLQDALNDPQNVDLLEASEGAKLHKWC